MSDGGNVPGVTCPPPPAHPELVEGLLRLQLVARSCPSRASGRTGWPSASAGVTVVLRGGDGWGSIVIPSGAEESPPDVQPSLAAEILRRRLLRMTGGQAGVPGPPALPELVEGLLRLQLVARPCPSRASELAPYLIRGRTGWHSPNAATPGGRIPRHGPGNAATPEGRTPGHGLGDDGESGRLLRPFSGHNCTHATGFGASRSRSPR